MPSQAQMDILWNISDTVLYPEAVAFIRHLVNDEECMPLPASQIIGLLNVANASSYMALDKFIKHQRDRNWPASKQDIKTLYTELEKLFTTIKNKRLRDEFHLIQTPPNSQEADEVMALVARDFIQHLIAENGLILAAKIAERTKRRERQA
jgi:hypothetical protein